MLPGDDDRLLAVLGVGDHIEPGPLEGHPHQAADVLGVVDDDHAEGRRRGRRRRWWRRRCRPPLFFLPEKSAWCRLSSPRCARRLPEPHARPPRMPPGRHSQMCKVEWQQISTSSALRRVTDTLGAVTGRRARARPGGFRSTRRDHVEPVRRREVHDPQPRGDRGRPAVRDHGGQHPHRAGPPARRPAARARRAPRATWSPRPASTPPPLTARAEAAHDRAAQGERRDRPAAGRLRGAHPRAGRARSTSPPSMKDDYVATEHLLIALAGDREPRAEAAHRRRADRDGPARGADRGARQPPGDQPRTPSRRTRRWRSTPST